MPYKHTISGGSRQSLFPGKSLFFSVFSFFFRSFPKDLYTSAPAQTQRPYTCRTPAARRALVQASMVAPVV